MYLVCGEALYDFFTQPDVATAGDEVDVRNIYFHATVGGSPLNLAVGISRLGAPAALCACISYDKLGTRLLNFLKSEKIDTNFVIRSAQPTPISLAQIDAAGLPHYAFYGAGAADTAMTAADLPQNLSAVNAIHFGSYATVVPPVADALATLVANSRDKFLAYDPNVRKNIQPDRAIWRTRFDEYVRAVDYIKLSAEDFAEIFPGEPADKKVTQWLADFRLQLVILTDELRTINAWHKNGWRLQVTPALPQKLIDSVGAGDSFQAAMLTQFDASDKRNQVAQMDESTLREKIYFASRCAAHTCSQKGANMPTKADMIARS